VATASAASTGSTDSTVASDEELLTALDTGSDATTPATRVAPRCGKVPTAIRRTQDLEKRLAANASTPGSLAYLQHRIDTAHSEHKAELVARLQKRMEFRMQLAQFLPERLALLQKAETTICSAGAVPTPGAS
jgi:hypothetical protein